MPSFFFKFPQKFYFAFKWCIGMCLFFINALDSRTIRLLENIYIYMVKLNYYTDIKQSLTPAGENERLRKYMYSAGIF